MARMFISGFKPKSTTKEAKNIIRSEIINKYKDEDYGDKKMSPLQKMKIDADHYNAGEYPRYKLSDYRKGAGLVDGGCFRCYYSDQAEFLSKIYGEKNVSTWPNQKIHDTYKHLIGREYNSMLREQERKGRK